MNLKFSNLISSMISTKANKSSLFNSTSLKPCSLNSLNIALIKLDFPVPLDPHKSA